MGTDKALLPWRGATFLGLAIEALQPLTEMIIVVGGANSEALKPIIYAQSAFLAINEHPERGQFSSLQLGLKEVLNRGRDAAIVTLVDRPAPTIGTVNALKDRFLSVADKGVWAVVPQFGEKHGHPIVVGREMIERFLRAPVTSSAREIEHANETHIDYFPVTDPTVTINVDTPEEFHTLNTSSL